MVQEPGDILRNDTDVIRPGLPYAGEFDQQLPRGGPAAAPCARRCAMNRLPTGRARIGRALLVVMTIGGIASSATALAAFPFDGETPSEPTATVATADVAAGPQEPQAPVNPIVTAPTVPLCSGNPADCVDPRMAEIQQTRPASAIPASCIVAAASPRGTTTAVPVLEAAPTSTGSAVAIRIEIEDGLGIDPDCFDNAVMTILRDPRGWTASQGVTFQRVETGADLHLLLASPSLTDRLCAPLNTAGIYSCRNQDRVILNFERWKNGADAFAGDLVTYRAYLVNHEVGHFLGKGHRSCPGDGLPAPVMMQQTKGVGSCLPNGWPTADERQAH